MRHWSGNFPLKVCLRWCCTKREGLNFIETKYFQHSLDPIFPMNLMVGEKSTAGKLSHFVPYKLLVMN